MSATAIDIFEAHRSKLIGLVYRITGSRFDAEEIVHDTFLKWFHADHPSIQEPYAWLAKVATRLALDHLKSARVQREQYIGPWLPEPFIEADGSLESEHEIDESVSMALMVLLERLAPAERATFILHDLFHFGFEEIAGILDKSEAACRKLASRARDKVRQEVPRRHPPKSECLEMASAFFGAVRDGDMAGLVAMLKDNVAFHADGGGKVAAALQVLDGRDIVAAFLLEKVRHDFVNAGTEHGAISYIWFNGSPGFVIWRDGVPVSAFNFDLDATGISKVYALRNPDKLRFFQPSADHPGLHTHH